MNGQRFSGQLVTVVLVLAMVTAPFLASRYSAVAGLIVMTVALSTTVILARGALGAVPAPTRRWLRAAIAVNVALAVACAVAALWLVARR